MEWDVSLCYRQVMQIWASKYETLFPPWNLGFMITQVKLGQMMCRIWEFRVNQIQEIEKKFIYITKDGRVFHYNNKTCKAEAKKGEMAK